MVRCVPKCFQSCGPGPVARVQSTPEDGVRLTPGLCHRTEMSRYAAIPATPSCNAGPLPLRRAGRPAPRLQGILAAEPQPKRFRAEDAWRASPESKSRRTTREPAKMKERFLGKGSSSHAAPGPLRGLLSWQGKDIPNAPNRLDVVAAAVCVAQL